jgi:hypothetical protein
VWIFAAAAAAATAVPKRTGAIDRPEVPPGCWHVLVHQWLIERVHEQHRRIQSVTVGLAPHGQAAIRGVLAGLVAVCRVLVGVDSELL